MDFLVWYYMGIMKIHCIGIGGIGLSALARYYVSKGHTVTGSDSGESELIKKLREEGISVFVGHDEKTTRLVSKLIFFSS